MKRTLLFIILKTFEASIVVSALLLLGIAGRELFPDLFFCKNVFGNGVLALAGIVGISAFIILIVLFIGWAFEQNKKIVDKILGKTNK